MYLSMFQQPTYLSFLILTVLPIGLTYHKRTGRLFYNQGKHDFVQDQASQSSEFMLKPHKNRVTDSEKFDHAIHGTLGPHGLRDERSESQESSRKTHEHTSLREATRKDTADKDSQQKKVELAGEAHKERRNYLSTDSKTGDWRWNNYSPKRERMMFFRRNDEHSKHRGVADLKGGNVVAHRRKWLGENFADMNSDFPDERHPHHRHHHFRINEERRHRVMEKKSKEEKPRKPTERKVKSEASRNHGERKTKEDPPRKLAERLHRLEENYQKRDKSMKHAAYRRIHIGPKALGSPKVQRHIRRKLVAEKIVPPNFRGRVKEIIVTYLLDPSQKHR